VNHFHINWRCCALLSLVFRFLTYRGHVKALAIRHAHLLHLTARLSGLRTYADLRVHIGLLHLNSFPLHLARRCGCLNARISCREVRLLRIQNAVLPLIPINLRDSLLDLGQIDHGLLLGGGVRR